MANPPTEDAIVIQDVVKNFRKRTIRGEYTTFKSELVRWLRGNRVSKQGRFIESLRGVNLRIPKGQTVAILGRNGSGKSTLLKLITGSLVELPVTSSREMTSSAPRAFR